MVGFETVTRKLKENLRSVVAKVSAVNDST